jgi:hypothetical protein
MASTYVNDLRLNEMATGDASGSWGTVTNTNLELIGEAFSYGTETIGDADSTLTIADGAADAARSFYLKITSSVDLTTTRIVTLGPNTVSKVWMIENATTGSQVITIKQGSGATINVPNGQVKMISTDGAGSGGAVLDLLVDVDLTGTTTLVNLDVSGTLGVTGVLTATSLDISGDIDVDGTTNLDVVDIDGATQIDATVTVGVDDTGYDVKFFGATTGKSLLWDESADSLIVTGTTTLVGTTNLDAVDIDGATQIDATVTVGVDDTGYDVKFFGATAGAYMLWDESADDLILGGAAGLSVNSTALVTGVLTTTAATVFNGGFAANDGSTISTADNTAQLTLISTDADDQVGPLMQFYRNSSSPANNDNIGRLIFQSKNDAGETIDYTTILNTASNVGDGVESGTFLVQMVSAGSQHTPFYINSAGFVFNEDSKDMDFRVESDTNAHMLFVDAGLERVNIGYVTTNSGVVSLSVTGVTPVSGTNTYYAQRISSEGFADSGAYTALIGLSVEPDAGWSKGAIGWTRTGGYDIGNIVFLNRSAFDASTAALSDERMRITSTGVVVTGSLSKSSGSFRIPHPIKSETHDLVHSFVEAPQADNIYRGKVTMIAGQASVNIDTIAGMTDGTFAVLNREVQCFTSNETGWTAVRGSVSGNILTIEAQDASCTDTISWMVIGERQDQHMYDTEWTDENGKVIVEPLKPVEE